MAWLALRPATRSSSRICARLASLSRWAFTSRLRARSSSTRSRWSTDRSRAPRASSWPRRRSSLRAISSRRAVSSASTLLAQARDRHRADRRHARGIVAGDGRPGQHRRARPRGGLHRRSPAQRNQHHGRGHGGGHEGRQQDLHVAVLLPRPSVAGSVSWSSARLGTARHQGCSGRARLPGARGTSSTDALGRSFRARPGAVRSSVESDLIGYRKVSKPLQRSQVSESGVHGDHADRSPARVPPNALARNRTKRQIGRRKVFRRLRGARTRARPRRPARARSPFAQAAARRGRARGRRRGGADFSVRISSAATISASRSCSPAAAASVSGGNAAAQQLALDALAAPALERALVLGEALGEALVVEPAGLGQLAERVLERPAPRRACARGRRAPRQRCDRAARSTGRPARRRARTGRARHAAAAARSSRKAAWAGGARPPAPRRRPATLHPPARPPADPRPRPPPARRRAGCPASRRSSPRSRAASPGSRAGRP